MGNMQPHPEPRRILIVRLSALGDIVMASGLITALKARYPHAELSWVTEAVCAPLLKHNPQLHQVLIWPRGQWQALWKAKQYRALWQAIRTFRKMLRDQQFDLVLDGQGLLKSGLCAWFTGAPRRVSIIAREGSHLLVHERIVPPAGVDDRIGAEYRFAACYLGAQDADYQLNLAVGAAPRDVARQTLKQAWGEQAGSRPMVMLCPFTTRPQKHWVESYWSDLVASLQAQGFQAVLLGGPTDKEAAERIAAASPGLINMTGRLKLDESVALIADSQLLIGVDTGLTHMGTALRIPTLALFGSTRPYLRTGTPSTTVMYDALPCSPCRRHPTCDGAFTCMKQLTVARVMEQAMALYQKAQA